MKFFNKLAKLAGKDSFIIDDNISIIYLMRLCFKYGIMKIRGYKKAFFYKRISSNIMIGKKVKLIEKDKLIIGRNTKIEDNVKIDAMSQNGVELGENVSIGENSIIKCTGSLEKIGVGMKIGNRTTFGNDCFFGAAGGISIGNDVIAGQYIRFHSENHNYMDKNVLIRKQGVTHKGIKIGNNCWIGSGVVFLDGAEIGDGCVVAANAIVNKKYGNNVVLGGMPAKILKER